MGYARTAAASSNEAYALAGLWLEAITYADRGDAEQANAVLARLTAKDPNIDSEASAQANLNEAMAKLKERRKAHNLPEICN